MRRAMLGGSELLAGVFIGGMEGVLAEYRLLEERGHVPLVPEQARELVAWLADRA